jgi:hypothetical protein
MEEITEDDGFGFSFVSEVVSSKNASSGDVISVDTVKKTAANFKSYHVAVNAFLNKLKSDPTRDTIKWPNRAVEIEKFQERLNSLYEERPTE